MLKLRRPNLDGIPHRARQSPLSADLAGRQQAVDAEIAANPAKRDQIIKAHWGRFKANDTMRASRGQPAIKTVLQGMSHGKCAYCESPGATDIEHHWPKAPAPENGDRGSHMHMFRWENLLYACSLCNSLAHKGSRMEWTARGRTKLLDPSTPGDDPLCYLSIGINAAADVPLGWMDPRAGLATEAHERAGYTIRLLGLNTRDQLRRGRALAIRHFYVLLQVLLEHGPAHVSRTGTTVETDLCEFLSGQTPYLAPVRQILHTTPGLRDELVAQVPALRAILDTWDLHPDDCLQDG